MNTPGQRPAITRRLSTSDTDLLFNFTRKALLLAWREGTVGKHELAKAFRVLDKRALVHRFSASRKRSH